MGEVGDGERVVSDIAVGVVTGLGVDSYRLGLDAALRRVG